MPNNRFYVLIVAVNGWLEPAKTRATCVDVTHIPKRGRGSVKWCIHGVFGTTGQVVPTSGQVVETTCECSVVSTTDFYQLSGSVQLQI